LGFFREKNIYKQLAQLATARGATETRILRMPFIFDYCCLFFAQIQNASWELIT